MVEYQSSKYPNPFKRCYLGIENNEPSIAQLEERGTVKDNSVIPRSLVRSRFEGFFCTAKDI